MPKKDKIEDLKTRLLDLVDLQKNPETLGNEITECKEGIKTAESRMTIHDILVAHLEAEGQTRVEAKTRKYTVLKRSVGSGGFWFVGPAGALRYGNTSSKSNVATKTRARILGEDARPLPKPPRLNKDGDTPEVPVVRVEG